MDDAGLPSPDGQWLWMEGGQPGITEIAKSVINRMRAISLLFQRVSALLFQEYVPRKSVSIASGTVYENTVTSSALARVPSFPGGILRAFSRVHLLHIMNAHNNISIIINHSVDRVGLMIASLAEITSSLLSHCGGYRTLMFRAAPSVYK